MPPKAEKGAAKKQSRVGANSIKMLQRIYRAKKAPHKTTGNVATQVEAMLKSGKAVGAKGPKDFSAKNRKSERPQRDADDFIRVQGRQRGIDVSDVL